ncbi:uncharacterized protein VNE69_12008 [Vairimorpha necatrix]|uniref:Uncharacterized protein n=1 Tax=Vairimorpha necatrix TaxID=6039 RepID=A0AAX4JGR9_9MICR
MFYKEKPEDGKNYKKIKVDEEIFYKLETTEKKKKRYSDQLKDPLYAQQDMHRKLKMIKKFRENNEDLDDLIEKWESLISECIIIMNREYEVSVKELFKIFNLEDYGFLIDEYE